jgi:hypothetical protein
MRRRGLRIAFAVAVFVVLINGFSDARLVVKYLDYFHNNPNDFPAFYALSDFSGYYIGAWIVRNGQSANLYDFSKRKIDPVIDEDTDPGSVYSRTTLAHGFANVTLYDCPPTLADLMIPFTTLSPLIGLIVWQALNLPMLLGSSLILTRLLELKGLGLEILVVVFLFMFRPTWEALSRGQITIALLLVVLGGLSFYRRNQMRLAGLMFAFAAAIKLTPLIVIVPFLAWRDWRILRSLASWGAIIVGALLLVNGPSTLWQYVFHVVPSMGNKAIVILNLNLISAVEVFWYGSDGPAPAVGVVGAGKVLSILVLCYAAWLCRPRSTERMNDSRKVAVLSVFLLLSCCISPVSWMSAYVLAAPALVVCYAQALEKRTNSIEAILALSLLPSFMTGRFARLATDTGRPIFYYLQMMTPIIGVALAFVMLLRLRTEGFAEIARGDSSEPALET